MLELFPEWLRVLGRQQQLAPDPARQQIEFLRAGAQSLGDTPREWGQVRHRHPSHRRQPTGDRHR